MAKANGLGYSLTIDNSSGSGQDISNDITDFTLSTPRATQDITGIDKSARETLLLLADMSINVKGVFNASANKSHAVFSTVPSTSVARTVAHSIGGKTLSTETNFTDYQLNRGPDGKLDWTAPGVLADGTVPTWA